MMNKGPVDFDLLNHCAADSDVWPDANLSAQMLAEYEHLIQLKSEDAQRYFMFGITFLGLGDEFKAHAVEAFGRVLQLRPDWAKCLVRLSQRESFISAEIVSDLIGVLTE